MYVYGMYVCVSVARLFFLYTIPISLSVNVPKGALERKKKKKNDRLVDDLDTR